MIRYIYFSHLNQAHPPCQLDCVFPMAPTCWDRQIFVQEGSHGWRPHLPPLVILCDEVLRAVIQILWGSKIHIIYRGKFPTIFRAPCYFFFFGGGTVMIIWVTDTGCRINLKIKYLRYHTSYAMLSKSLRGDVVIFRQVAVCSWTQVIRSWVSAENFDAGSCNHEYSPWKSPSRKGKSWSKSTFLGSTCQFLGVVNHFIGKAAL